MSLQLLSFMCWLLLVFMCSKAPWRCALCRLRHLLIGMHFDSHLWSLSDGSSKSVFELVELSVGETSEAHTENESSTVYIKREKTGRISYPFSPRCWRHFRYYWLLSAGRMAVAKSRTWLIRCTIAMERQIQHKYNRGRLRAKAEPGSI